MYSYLTDDCFVVEKAKCTKKCAVNANLNLIVSERLENNKMVLKAQQTLRSKARNAFTEKVNKIPVSANIT